MTAQSQKVFIVTGASKGLGAAIATYLLQHSHKLVLSARSGDLLEGMKREWPGQVEYLAGDWESSPDLAQKLVQVAVEAFGRIDGLVVNHGVLRTQRLAETTMDEMKRVFEVNFFSCLSLAQASLAELRKARGCIVWVSTGAATNPYAAFGSYASSKAAMNNICQTLAQEEPDITNIAVAPGRVNTEMQARVRSTGEATMNKAQFDTFTTAFEQGTLLEPKLPGHVIAKFVVEPRQDLSGMFVKWNSPEMAAYQS